MLPLEELERSAVAAGCLTVREEPMSRHTTFRIGGPADLFVTVCSAESLELLMRETQRLQIPLFLLGKGSNLLVSDSGVRGCVACLSGDFHEVSLSGETEIVCGPAVSLAGLCNFAKKYELTGLEFAWGIPASVGGAAYMNAGAYNGEMSSVIQSVHALLPDGSHQVFSGESLQYGYRHSVFMENGGVITRVVCCLSKGNRDAIALLMEDYYTRRKEKQPLNKPSAGSVFKRPEGHFAGALIEQCGLKGLRVGGAMVSEKHAGFIVNAGGATCADVCALIEKIQETVLRETGVSLECEVKRIGEQEKTWNS
ncbi:MAG TPA: UDP-N-acetylmuramate dehydrogenase [Candidatus Caccousia avicola]|uniref:UDP-N-acetylenolpyruvoylglucosamine reductase n=1 Tax=Candidatus Caccousia avicola TaxID=2840721 RepID=A0A9D1ANS1_9FIRM|nr:UDP-N-acetylmuramate dehydrogenase [Candidatus Caccousia avicola]